jgi:beta-glucosidase
MDSVDHDIEALIARMTLEEKAGQLSCIADSIRPIHADVNPDTFTWRPEQIRDMVRAGQVGALFNGVGAAAGREIQRIAVEESRLGIPLLFGADIIHGMRTVFPIPLAEAASFEPELAERTSRAMAVEATREGIHWTYAPMVDLARDQRWGRVAESAGEDPFMVARFAVARVRGFQGDDLTADESLLATPKHFAAYGAVEAGLEYNRVDLSLQSLYELHLPAFKAAIDAGALTIMTAFNDVNGVPASASSLLLTEILRKQWGFEGFVLSDYTSDFDTIAHGFAADEREAAYLCFSAGLDMSMQSAILGKHLPGLVRAGSVPEARLDEAVQRVLAVKAKVGLFLNPYRCLDPQRECDEPRHLKAHDALARQAARRSVVLVKNECGVLPLRKAGQRIALIGPFASDRANLTGCWDLFGDPTRTIPLDAGLRAALADASQLVVEPGSDVESAIDGGIERAMAAARRADVVVLALGEPSSYSGEAQSRTHIVLPAIQQALAEAVQATRKPLVVLLRNGRALALSGAVRDAQAILVTWFLGTQMGHAVADVLFGDYNPSGRLPVSFPLDSGQQPFYYNQLSTGRPYIPGGPREYTARWREQPHSAIYPFGHGLGYSPFRYGTTELNSQRLGWNDSLTAATQITNEGTRTGEEVVQLYIRDRVASRVRPIRELKAFTKVALAPGETQTVTFALTRRDLQFRGVDNQLIVEPGQFDLWVAPSSTAGEAVSFELLGPCATPA